MTITISEAIESRDVNFTPDDYTQELTFIIKSDPGDITDETTVKDFVIFNAPQFIDNLPFNSISEIERINEGCYIVKVIYDGVLSPSE